MMALTDLQRTVLERIRSTMEDRFEEVPLRARGAIDGLVKVRNAPNQELKELAYERLTELVALAKERGVDSDEADALLRIEYDDVDTGPYFNRLLRVVLPSEVLELLLRTE